jgi:hypothetical protein
MGLRESGEVVSLTRRRRFLPLPPQPENSRYSFLLRGSISPRIIVRLEGLDQLKNEIQWRRESNTRPYGFLHSTSTDYATACLDLHQ